MTLDSKQQRVAIYSRVSSQEQATEGVSIEAQIAALRAYAKSQGWEIAGEYIDMGASAVVPTTDPPSSGYSLMRDDTTSASLLCANWTASSVISGFC